MEAKEKAKELVENFLNKVEDRTGTFLLSNYSAKQCALIAVNEILNNFGSRVEENIHYCNYSVIQFYEEVKIEIEKL